MKMLILAITLTLLDEVEPAQRPTDPRMVTLSGLADDRLVHQVVAEDGRVARARLRDGIPEARLRLPPVVFRERVVPRRNARQPEAVQPRQVEVQAVRSSDREQFLQPIELCGVGSIRGVHERLELQVPSDDVGAQLTHFREVLPDPCPPLRRVPVLLGQVIELPQVVEPPGHERLPRPGQHE